METRKRKKAKNKSRNKSRKRRTINYRIGKNLLNKSISNRLWRFMKTKGDFGSINELIKNKNNNKIIIYKDNNKKLFFKIFYWPEESVLWSNEISIITWPQSSGEYDSRITFYLKNGKSNGIYSDIPLIYWAKLSGYKYII